MRSIFIPKLREADENDLIGIRGYLNYFQDMATEHVHTMGKGNDTIPDDYGICWIYAKYKMHLEKEADFNPIELETWIETTRFPGVIHQALEVSRDGELFAVGRLESCLTEVATGRLAKPSSIEFPTDVYEDRHAELPPFVKLPKTADGTEYVYSHTVRYTDLDRNRHMTNLRYVGLLMDGFDSAFYKANTLTDIELHYLSQCYEGEEIRICRKNTAEGWLVFCVHTDGRVAAVALMGFKERA